MSAPINPCVIYSRGRFTIERGHYTSTGYSLRAPVVRMPCFFVFDEARAVDESGRRIPSRFDRYEDAVRFIDDAIATDARIAEGRRRIERLRMDDADFAERVARAKAEQNDGTDYI